MVYAPVGPTASSSFYSSPGYSNAIYSLDIQGTNNKNEVKTIRVNGIQGPILDVDITYSKIKYPEDKGTVRVITSNGPVVTTISGTEWGKVYLDLGLANSRETGVKGKVTIKNYLINNTIVTTQHPSTNVPGFTPKPDSIKRLNIVPQKIKNLLNDLILTANKNNPFLRAQLDTSNVPDDLLFNGYKTSGNFDALSVLIEIAKTYSLFLTYENAIPALGKHIDPEYYELHESDFVTGEADALYQIEYTDLRQTPKELIFKYSNSEQDLQDDVVVSRSSATEYDGGITEESTAFSLTHTIAKGLAQNQLATVVSRGVDYSFKLHPRRRDLKIGSLLYYAEFGNIVKCEEIKYGFDHTLQVKAVVYNPILDYQLPNFTFDLNGSSTASSSSSNVSNPSVEGNLAPKNLPIFNSSDLNNSLYVGLVADSNYRNGEVRFSTDGGASYASAFNLSNPSSYGELGFALGDYATHLLEDKGNEPVVKMAYGELYSQTEADYNNYSVLLLVNKEIITYRYATLQADGYRLRNLQRGLFGTEKYIQLHPAGSQVFLLGSLNRITDDLSNIDRPRIAILVDHDQIASDSLPVDATNNGESIRPYNPHIWSVKKDRATGDIAIRWSVRDRLQPGFLNNFVAQTDGNNFKLKIGASREVATANLTYLYTSAMQTADTFTGNSLILDLIHIGSQAVNSLSQSKSYVIY
jgi:hypothetical protein